ncbi:MAG: transcriptional regulator NrdR, partial [Vampirovibrionia bacterium]
VNNIEIELTSAGKKEVTSHYLGKLVLNELKNFDKVAYIRYACIYKEYKGIEDFINEAQSLIDEIE